MFLKRRDQRQALRVGGADDLRLNLSFVLHERSESVAVDRAARACLLFAGWVANAPKSLATPRTTLGDPAMQVDGWLSTSIGVARLLSDALAIQRATSMHVQFVDTIVGSTQLMEFFRAPARLAVPPLESCRLGVAALVVRPGQSSTQLELAGPFSWPQDAYATLRAIEHIIQRHVDQWLPERALWETPAEALLGSEVR